MTLPDDVLFILDALKANRHDAFVVGGCVRDRLMGAPPKDWDFATSALPHDIKKVFAHTFDTGLQHGTVTVVLNQVNYEVTTFRIDGDYADCRRPASVSFAACIEDDLGRRDFTMNAIAFSPDRGFVDPFGGQEDIANQIIRCVGVAAHRFNEDALRMLRAVRFSAQLGFDIQPETMAAIAACKQNLTHISAERVREELTRLLASPHPQKIIDLQTLGLLDFMLQGYTYGDDLAQVAERIGNTPCRLNLRLALFFAWCGEDAPKVLRALRFDNKTILEVGAMIHLLPSLLPHSRYALKKLLSKTSPAIVEGVATLQQDEHTRDTLRDILRLGECFTLRDLEVKGSDLIRLGIKPGKQIGDLLDTLLDMTLRDPSLNDYNKLIRIIPSLIS